MKTFLELINESDNLEKKSVVDRCKDRYPGLNIDYDHELTAALVYQIELIREFRNNFVKFLNDKLPDNILDHHVSKFVVYDINRIKKYIEYIDGCLSAIDYNKEDKYHVGDNEIQGIYLIPIDMISYFDNDNGWISGILHDVYSFYKSETLFGLINIISEFNDAHFRAYATFDNFQDAIINVNDIKINDWFD